MKTISSILVFLFAFSLLGYSQNLQTTSKPIQELIVRYELISSPSSEMTGPDILEEHEQFIATLGNQLSLSIRYSQPVFRSFVNKMVSQGISEPRLLEQIRQQNQVRRGRQLPKYELHSNNSFCRTLRLAIETEDLERSIHLLQHASSSLEPLGFRILYVSPSRSFASDEAPNDPWYPNQYAHQLTGAPAAWELQRGSGEVVIGVLDSGIDFMHEDFIGNILQGADFVDWPFLEEWEKVEGEDFIDYDLDPTDFHGHGTSVSGVIGTQIDNEIGVSGVCPNCKILPLKVLASRYISNEERMDTFIQSRYINGNLADGIIYGVDAGADILNMSLGGSAFDTLGVLYQAIQYAHQNEVLMIASAGNDNGEEEHYPAAYEELVSVASTDESDRKSSFSNFGNWVDVSAPGSRIITTAPVFEGFPLWSFGSLELAGEDQLFDPGGLSFSGFTQNGPITTTLSYVGLAREVDLLDESFDWNLDGKIALIERGEITFKEKVDRANAFGAVGVIIFNNNPGRFSGTLIEQQENPIPALTLSQEEGQSLLEAWNQDYKH